jgi:hypothetical protein
VCGGGISGFRLVAGPPAAFFFLLFFSTFLGVSWQGEFKNTIKSPCRRLFPKKSTKISMSVFPRLFLFYRVFGCFSATGVQKHYKKRFGKKSCRNVFTEKKIDQKSKTYFSRFFSHVFWRFLLRGEKNTTIFFRKQNPTLVLFWPLTHPPTTGAAAFIFW